MNSLNVLGRITKDLELRYTQNNKAILDFYIAVDRQFSEETDFIKCTAWEKTAEFIAKYFTKGQRIGITGSIQTNNYENADGVMIYTTFINVGQAHFADGKKETENNNSSNNNNNNNNKKKPNTYGKKK